MASLTGKCQWSCFVFDIIFSANIRCLV